MEASSAANAMTPSAVSTKSPVCVRIRRNKAVHSELEGEPVAVGRHKH
jgi:hypothetical protein